MASAQKVVVIDLGTSTLKVGEFGIGRGGTLTLLRFAVAELGLDPNKEEDRAPRVTETLKGLLKSQGIRGRDARISVSGQSIFMKFVKLPPVSPDQVEQVVAFEAQQNVPFPINEVTWDYQMMPNRGTGAEAEAVIVAIKKEVIEAEIAAVEAAGVRVRHIDVAPFAMLNAFRYSEPPGDECSLIVDIGARTTNLIFVEKNSFWIRNVPIAGNQISQSICNELQEPFTAAETLKKGKGFVSLGGVYADPDDVDAARISKLIRSTLTKLHVDINRSIAYYRTTLGGTAPKRAFLVGGSSQLPYLDLFIADKLSLPVNFFNPLRNVNLGPNINTAQLQQNSCYCGELVGLALRPSGSSPAEITLDAPTLRARADKKRKQPYFYCGLFAWIAMFVCLGLNYWQQINLTQQTTKELQSETVELQANAPKLEKLAQQADALQATVDLAVQLGQQRAAWPAIIDALNQKIPPGVWITQLTPAFDPKSASATQGGPGALRTGIGQPPPQPTHAGPTNLEGFQAPTDRINVLVIEGLYHGNKTEPLVSTDDLRQFIDQLSALPIFDIDPKKATDQINYTSPEADPTTFAPKFSMHLKLKEPIPLAPSP